MLRCLNLAGILCVNVILLPGTPQPQEASAEAKGVTVSGVVINSVTQEPVRRAEVTLTPAPPEAVPGQPRGAGASGAPGAGSPAERADAVKAAMRTALTGADGAFRFDNVGEGVYRVYVRREGMVPGRPAPGLSPQQFRVAAGLPVTGLRYSLTPQAVISGRVLDDEGEPVQGVQVMALRRAPPDARKPYQPAGPMEQTDDRGQYRLRNLPAGRYLVQAMPMGQAAMEQAENQRTALTAAFYPDARSPREAIWVSAGAGQEIGNVDIRLRRAPVRRISGRVLMEDGKPAERFMVMKLDRDAPMTFMMSGRMAMGREAGSFVLESVPPGRYTLMARLMDNQNPLMQRAALADVEVGDRDLENVEIRFLPPFVLRGQIRVEGPGAEQVKTQLGRMQVNAMPSPAGPSFSQAAVKEDGSFEMTLHAPGRYRLFVYQGSPAQTYLASIRTAGGSDVTREMDLTLGAAEPVIVTLRTDAARITAKRPPADKENEWCNPYFAAAVPVLEEERTVRAPIRAPADESGEAVLFPVPPGEYYVFGVCAPDLIHASDPEILDSLPQKAERVRLQAGEQKTVTLKDATPQ
jgi:hypothetical protein